MSINCQIFYFTYVYDIFLTSLHSLECSICRSLVILKKRKLMGVQQLSLGCSFMNNVVAIQWHTRRRMTSGGMSKSQKSLQILGSLKKRSFQEKEKSSTSMTYLRTCFKHSAVLSLLKFYLLCITCFRLFGKSATFYVYMFLYHYGLKIAVESVLLVQMLYTVTKRQ